MTDITATIQPKTDQMNYDHLLTGPITITVSGVRVNTSSEQPVIVNFEGDDGKPFKPCKSMRRVMAKGWGADSSKYVGRSMTLYGDQDVIFGGQKVGGIRISHMSHIDRPISLPLSASKTKRILYKVEPLRLDSSPQAKPTRIEFSMETYTRAIEKIISESETHDELQTRFDRMSDWRRQAAQTDREQATKLREQVNARLAELSDES